MYISICSMVKSIYFLILFLSFQGFYKFYLETKFNDFFQHIDCSSQAFLTNLLTDFFHCLITPSIIIFSSQTGKRRIQKLIGLAQDQSQALGLDKSRSLSFH